MHEPISWLTLERLHLGELPPEEAARVRARLAADPTLAGRMEQIRQASPLPTLPQIAARARPSPSARRPWWVWAPPALLAAAAAIALAVWPPAPVDEAKTVGPGIKGGQTHALSVVALRGGQVVDTEGGFLASDTLKVMITCTPPDQAQVQIVVFQSEEVSLPYSGPQAVQCGNTVAVPGAFRLSPEPAKICALLDDEYVEESRLRRLGAQGLPKTARCVRLSPMESTGGP